MEALKSNDITAEAFLNRLTFNESKVCDYLADFPDEIFNELIIEDFDSVVEDIDEPSIDSSICPACSDRKREVICMPCRHQYFCVPCYEKWAATNPDLFDLMDENGNVPNANLPHDVKCPVCKQTISMIICPIVA